MSKLLAVRWGKTLAVAVLGVVMLGASSGSRFNELGHKMICVCGCGQILLECNHVGCPDSDRMIGELRAQISSGGGDSGIYNWFVAKYGATVLAAPMRGGFDNVAWITPFAVFLLAIGGTIYLIVTWKRRSDTRALPGGPNHPAAHVDVVSDRMRDRIRHEVDF